MQALSKRIHPFTIPNILTILRIVAIPVIVIIYYLPYDGRYLLSAAIFAAAGVTDWFDGYLARKWGQSTKLGAFLDPVADKLIVAAALVLLVDAYAELWMAIPAMVIISREITISALREWMAEVGKRASVAVSYIGKVKTFAQMAAITGLLAVEPSLESPIAILSFVLLYAATVLTLWSMMIYLKAAWPDLKE